LNNCRIIARTLFATALLALLVACSTVRLTYNQAPHLMYWWIDGYADLNGTQSAAMRRDIDQFLDWHRGTELPGYAVLLQQWQTLATQDMSAAQACAQFDAVRAALLRAGERGVEPLTRLALTLSAEQQAHLQRHQHKASRKFEKEFLRGSPEQRLNRRLDQAVGRAETLYGRLTPAQRELVRAGLQRSPFDPQITGQERLRRQADLHQTVQALQASAGPGAAPTPAAQATARAFVTRVMEPPTPGHAAYSRAMAEHGCAQFAALHNSTSAEQRAHAVRVLRGYEDDLRVLVAQR
jgi:hypothetical protein